MSQRWPIWHRGASGLESMAALRHSGFRHGAGKHNCQVDWNHIGAEVEASILRTPASKEARASMSVCDIYTMPCCLRHFGHSSTLGPGMGLGFWSVKTENGDWLSPGSSLGRSNHLRCWRNGDKYNRLHLDPLLKNRRGVMCDLGLRYVINFRQMQKNSLQPIFAGGLSNLANCYLPLWGDSRCIRTIANSMSGESCTSASCEEASIDDKSSCTAPSMSSSVNEVSLKHLNSFRIGSVDEHTRESDTAQEASRTALEERSSNMGVDQQSREPQFEPTVIVFDIETTGFLKPGTKIVELACRDLAGGERSTLETLVNPGQIVPAEATAIHKITSEMVNRVDIPSWTEVMGAFIDFVEGRRKGTADVILIAHNGRRFDVPFIMKECLRCSMEIPSHWYFVDSMDIAKTMLKKRFGKIKLYNLNFLYYECYKLPRLKDAHRAGVDVDMLASVFGLMLIDLELPVSKLLDQAFRAEDIELKPNLLLGINNDRYTAPAKEVDVALFEQSMVDPADLEDSFVITAKAFSKEADVSTSAISTAIAGQGFDENLVDFSLGDKIGISTKSHVHSHDIKAAVHVTTGNSQSDEFLESSSKRIVGGGNLMSEGAEEISQGVYQLEVKENISEAFNPGLNPGEEILGTTLGTDCVKEVLEAAEEYVSHPGNQVNVKDDHVSIGPLLDSTDEERLGLRRGAAAIDGAVCPSEGLFASVTLQENVSEEYEAALGLKLGNDETVAGSRNLASSFSDAKDEHSLTGSLSSPSGVSLQNCDISRSFDEGGAVHIIENQTSNDVLVAVRPLDRSSTDSTVRLYRLELADEVRPLSQAGDGTLQPLNIGGTLLKKKKGKRRGTGDVQTTAIRNIAHTVADCEEHVSLAESAVLEIQELNAVQPALDQEISESQHAILGENHKGEVENLHTSSVNMSLLSPMMKQYVETKRQRPKYLLLSRVGDFYEAFFEDAERLAHACNIRLAAVDGGKLLERKVPMAGIPYHKVDVYLRTLLGKGIAVVKQDQVAGTDAKGVTTIERQVAAVLTPGTLLDEGMLEGSCNNFLVAIFPHSDENGTWGLAFSDISTGEFQATQGQGRSALLHELLRLQPSEVIFPANAICIEDKETGALQPFGMPNGLCYSSRPTSEFFPGAAEKKLQSSFGKESLEAFGLLRSSHAIRAAGGLLGYVQETQKLINEEIPLQKPSYYSIMDTMHMDDTVRSHLELLKTSRWGKVEGSVVWALDDTRTAMGGRLLRRWLLWPLIDFDQICTRQDAVEVFVHNHDLRSKFRNELSCVCDIERVAARIAWKQADARDLLDLAQSIQTLPDLAEISKGASSNSYFLAASDCPMLAVEWANKVEEIVKEVQGIGVQPGRVVKEGVDEILDKLQQELDETISWLEEFEKQERKRTGIPSLEVGHNKNMGHYISIRKNKLKEDAIPKEYQRLQSLKAEERFVTPSLLQCETRRLAAEVKVSEREEGLLKLLKEEIVSLLDTVREFTQALAALDVLSTFADLAVRRDYCRPHMLESGREMTIVGGRHPVVELSLPEDSSFVPNSAYLGYESALEKASAIGSSEPGYLDKESTEEDLREALTGECEKWWPRADLVILTGPNASGKSCYLRQLGLIQLLAQAGCFVPAKFCQLSVADGLYTRVGAVDDLAAGQSTFKVEMVESANILNRATAHSLVLLDEVGRGTSSQEGGVIARAIIEYLSQKVRARTIFSTHYHSLHVLDQEFPNIANYYFQATELQNGEVIFDHSVMPGFAVKSHAIAIGRGAGLPDWVCNRADELLALEEDSVQLGVFLSDRVQNTESQTNNKVQQEIASEVFDVMPCSGSEEQGVNHLVEGSSDSSKEAGRTVAEAFEGSSPQESAQEELKDISLEVGIVATEEAIVLEMNDQCNEMIQESSCTIIVEENFSKGQEDPDVRLMDISTLTEGMDVESRVDGSDVGPGHSEDQWNTRLQLDEVWEHVCVALQNQPATQALSKQKGSLVSVKQEKDVIHVCMGASILFVRKFQQPEHAAALESAFASVLEHPVHLHISVVSATDSPSR